MSIKSSDSNVESVAGVVLAGLAFGGVIVAASVIRGMAQLLSNTGRKIYDESVATLPTFNMSEIKSISRLREDRKSSLNNFLHSKTGMDNLEVLKAQTLANLSSASYFISDSRALEKSLSMLENASTLQQLKGAEKKVISFLENSHSDVLLNSTTSAYCNASSKIGFNQITTEMAKDGTTRIIAVDPAGRAIVTEVSRGQDHNLSIATEIVGVSDESCNKILDDFNNAVTEEGVRRSPGKRSFTGGVCELASARDFIRRKIQPKLNSSSANVNRDKTNDGIQRTRQLNDQARQKQKR